MEIVFEHPHVDVSAFRSHVSHYASLYRSLADEVAKPPQRPDESVISPVWGQIEAEWYGVCADDVRQIGYVMLYHLWEKQLTGLIQRQARKNGVAFPERLRKALVRDPVPALAAGFQVTLDSSLMPKLEKARLFANAFKHGRGPSLLALRKRHPEFFANAANPASEHEEEEGGFYGTELLRVQDHHLAELEQAIDKFWDRFPHRIDYSGPRKASGTPDSNSSVPRNSTQR